MQELPIDQYPIVPQNLTVLPPPPGVNEYSEGERRILRNIEWLWAPDGAGDAPPAQFRIWWEAQIPVEINGPFRIPRGPIGGRSCGNWAVLFALAGDEEGALQWFRASQAHNPSVVEEFGRYREMIIEYAIQHHRADALRFAGLTAWLTDANIPGGLQGDIVDVMSKTLGHHRPPPFGANESSHPHERDPREGPVHTHN